MATQEEGVGRVSLVIGEDVNGAHRALELSAEGEVRVSEAWAVEVQKDSAADDSDKSFTVPANTEWRLQSIHAELVTTATAGTRQLEVQIQDDAGDVLLQIPSGATQGVSETRLYEFAPHLADQTAFRDTDKITTPLPHLVLAAGYVVRVFDNAAVDPAADDLTVRILLQSRVA